MSGGATLAGLLGAAQAAEFLASHWPERHYAVHRPPGQLPAALRVPELASLDALAQRYRGEVTFGRGARDARTISADAYAPQLFRLGLTVYLPDIVNCLPGLQAWLHALESDLGLPAGSSKLGAFASPRNDGVSCHFDADDVISIQLQGSKVFHVAKVDGLLYPSGRQFGPDMLPGDELYPQAGDGFPHPHDADFERIVMQPGSVLFLPRGTWHRSEASEDSFSVSVGIRPPAAMDRLLQQLRDLLLQDPEWRRPLYEANREGAPRAALQRRVATLLRQLPAVLAQIDGEALLQGPQDARYQRVPMARLVHRPAGPRRHLTVTTWDHNWSEQTTLETETPQHLAAALDWLADRRAAFSAAELESACRGVPHADQRQLLTLLTRAGYLRQLWYPKLLPQHA